MNKLPDDFGSKPGDIAALLSAFDELPVEDQDGILGQIRQGVDVPAPKVTTMHLAALGLERLGVVTDHKDAHKKARTLEEKAGSNPAIAALLRITIEDARGVTSNSNTERNDTWEFTGLDGVEYTAQKASYGSVHLRNFDYTDIKNEQHQLIGRLITETMWVFSDDTGELLSKKYIEDLDC